MPIFFALFTSLLGAAAIGPTNQSPNADLMEDVLRRMSMELASAIQAATTNTIGIVRAATVRAGGADVGSMSNTYHADPTGSPCRWRQNSSTCGVNSEYADRWMATLSEDSTLRRIWDQQKVCQAKADNQSCLQDVDCQFSPTTGDCEVVVSPDVRHGLMGTFMSEKNCGWITGMQEGVTCALLDGNSENCSGTCGRIKMWVPNNDTCAKQDACAMNMEAAIQKMCGADFDFLKELRKCVGQSRDPDQQSKCMARACKQLGIMQYALYGNTDYCRANNSTQEACRRNATCMWNQHTGCEPNQLVNIAKTLPDGCMVKELLHLEGLCAAQPRDNCSKDCMWETYIGCDKDSQVDKSSCVIASNITWQLFASNHSREMTAFARLWDSHSHCDTHSDEASCNAAQHIHIGTTTSTTTTTKPTTSSSLRAVALGSMLPFLGGLALFASRVACQ